MLEVMVKNFMLMEKRMKGEIAEIGGEKTSNVRNNIKN